MLNRAYSVAESFFNKWVIQLICSETKYFHESCFVLYFSPTSRKTGAPLIFAGAPGAPLWLRAFIIRLLVFSLRKIFEKDNHTTTLWTIVLILLHHYELSSVRILRNYLTVPERNRVFRFRFNRKVVSNRGYNYHVTIFCVKKSGL